MSMRRLLAVFTLALAVAGPVAAWSTRADYSQAAFSAAAKEGRVIVLDFHADWCPTCLKQATVLAELGEEAALREVVLLVVDYDTASELKSRFGVSAQSTIVVLRGEQEISRATGVTVKDDLRAVIAKAL